MGEIGGAIIFFLLIGGFIYIVRRSFHRYQDFQRAIKARWMPDYLAINDHTNVFIDKSYINSKRKKCVIQSSEITNIKNNDDNFEEKFHQAMSEAQMRAYAYNSETK